MSKAIEFENMVPKPRKREARILRQKIMDAIVYSQTFWLVYKFNTFGMAGFIDLNYKKSYIEILFYTPSQAEYLNGRVLRINTPLLRELNFRPIFEEPDIDEKGFVNPKEIYKRIIKLAQNEIQAYIYILDNQVKKINEEYENYPINDNPYNRQIYIYLDKVIVDFSINFELFPKRPTFLFSKNLRKIISEEEFLQFPVLKDWSEENPASISYIIDQLMEEIVKRKKLKPWNSESQQLVFENVLISSQLPEINLRIHRGETLGIVHRLKENTRVDENINELFRVIAGTSKPIQGKVSYLQKPIVAKLKRKEKSTPTFIITTTLDPNLENLKVGRAISKNILITSKHAKFKNNRSLKRYVLEVSGLKNKENEIVNDLSVIERIKFGIARALLQSPAIIMFSLPEGAINRLQIQSFQLFLNKIKREFHIIIIVHGPKEIVSDCDKILTISEEKADSGTVEDLILQIPQSGEIIEIELNNLNPDALNKQVLSQIFESAIIIEERQNEKFKIFSQENPDELIIRLMRIIGPFLYNFKRFKPSLAEYLEFMDVIAQK
ncbi:MAG: hypothetical protein ACTSRZ_00545 [Promethearchaeota archaeon]